MPRLTRGAQLRHAAAVVVPPAVVIPAFLLLGVTVLYRFHRFWRWIRIGSLWANPDNFIQLTAGAGVNLLFGDKLPLRVAALMVWIPSRVVACVTEHNKLVHAFQKWKEAIRGDFPRLPSIRWISSSKGRRMSPSIEFFLREHAVIGRWRISRVIKATYKLVRRMFILSMVSVDALEALSLKKESCDRAVNEFFVDGANAIERIARERDFVQLKLEEGRPVINKLLKQMGTHYTVDRLVKSVSTAMDGIAAVDRGIKDVKAFGGGIVVDLGKQAAATLFSLLGEADKIPVGLQPGEWEEETFGVKSKEQYSPQKCRLPAGKIKSIGINVSYEPEGRSKLMIGRENKQLECRLAVNVMKSNL